MIRHLIFTILVGEMALKDLVFSSVCTSSIPNEIKLEQFFCMFLSHNKLSPSKECLLVMFAHFAIEIFSISYDFLRFFIYMLVLVG